MPAPTSPPATLDDIRRAFAQEWEPHPLPPGSASVLAPVVPGPGGPYLLLERRPRGPSVFAGQLSFPGGRLEPSDPTPLQGALREAHEEVGFLPGQVEVVGHLAELDNHLGRRVLAFVGIVPPAVIPPTPASAVEVEELILVPIEGLRSPGWPLPPDAPPLAYAPVRYEGREFTGRERPLHYWPLRAPDGREAVLWGLTAELVARMLRRLHGWTEPSPPRHVQDWDGLQP